MFNKVIIISVWVAIGIAIIWIAGFVIMKKNNESPIANISSPLDSFAQCLSDENVKMYGADWCSHCQNQKKLFGTSFKFINYIECADPSNSRKQMQACTDADISGYPTWIFSDNQRIEGEVTFDRLAEKTGCRYK